MRMLYRPPTHIIYGLVIAAFVWSWIGFKTLEPTLYPVITGFTIEHAYVDGDSTVIAGSMLKSRQCDFNYISAYSGTKLIDLKFTETISTVNRIKGPQDWGWWVLTPQVYDLTLYANHTCETGEVFTTLFDGVLVYTRRP